MSRSAASSKSRRSKGRHRKPAQPVVPYAWLGAGAITLGVGAALASGAGVAHAEDGATGAGPSSSAGTGSDAGSDNSGTPTGGTVSPPSTSLSGGVSVKSADADDSGSGTKTVGNTSGATGSPVTSLSASGGNVVTKDGDSSKITQTVKNDPVTNTVVVKADPKQAEFEQVSSPIVSDPPSSGSSNNSVDTQPVVRPLALARVVQPSLAAAAVDPAQVFRNADPTNEFLTPASADYANVTTSIKTTDIAGAVQQVGSAGFTRDAANNLVYTNTRNTDLLVMAGTTPAQLATLAYKVAPGKSVTIPTATGPVAGVILPRSQSPAGQVTFISVAGPGYPPNGTRPPASNSPDPIAALANAVNAVLQNAIQAINTGINNVVQLVNNVVRAITAPPAQQAPSGVGALYDRLRATTGDADDDGVHVDRVIGANDQQTRYIVYVGGTVPFSNNQNQQTLIRNTDSYKGVIKPNQIAAIDRAIGGNKNAKVMLVGYSQGGMDVQNIAATGRYNVTTVVTFGSPITKAPPTGYRVIHIAAEGDPIPGLSIFNDLQNNTKAGNVFYTRTSTYPNPFLLAITPLPLQGLLFANIHGDPATYRDAGTKFDSSQGYKDVKSNIANFRGKLDYSFN